MISTWRNNPACKQGNISYHQRPPTITHGYPPRKKTRNSLRYLCASIPRSAITCARGKYDTNSLVLISLPQGTEVHLRQFRRQRERERACIYLYFSFEIGVSETIGFSTSAFSLQEETISILCLLQSISISRRYPIEFLIKKYWEGGGGRDRADFNPRFQSY